MNFEKPKIISRNMNFAFDNDIPRFWKGGKAFSTHMLNSFTLLFPAGEKFFIQSINKFQKDIHNQELKEEVKLFVRQEIQHSKEHSKFFKNLEDNSYKIDPMLNSIEILLKGIEKYSPDKFSLALTAALEHITALLSEIALEDNFLADAEQRMKELFEWHAREEIEHRHVAYDVLNEIDDDYVLKISGLIGAYILFVTFSSSFTVYLLWQDKVLFSRPVLKEFVEIFFSKQRLFFKGCSIFFRYIHPNFHPLKEKSVDLLMKDFFKFKVRNGAVS